MYINSPEPVQIAIGDITASANESWTGGNGMSVDESDVGIKWFIYTNDAEQEIPGETTHIRVDPSVSEIRPGGFAGLKHVEVIECPRDLREIGARAFYACLSLSSLSLPQELEVIGERAFSHCPSLTHLTFPKSVQVIPLNACIDCSRLTAVQLPQGLVRIAEAAFRGCSSLSHISIPKTTTKIDACAFLGCTQLQSIELHLGLECIGNQAFRNCKVLRSILIPSSVNEIEVEAFSECSSLTSIELPSSLEVVSARLFSHCSSLTHILLPSTVTQIQIHAFRDCTRIEHLELPPKLNCIQRGSFQGCSSLHKLYVPSTVTEIHSEAFYRCSSLQSVQLPEGLEVLEEGLFMSCTALRCIHVPKSVIHIGARAFQHCHQLLAVELAEAGLLTLGNYCFSNCEHLAIIQLPSTIATVGDDPFHEADEIRNAYLCENTTDDDSNNDGDDDSDSYGETSNVLVNALTDRFKELPIHSLCYGQSFSTIEAMHDILRNAAPTSLEDEVDAFGFTPFHIIAQSTRPNLELVKELAERYPMRVLTKLDAWDMTPLHYLVTYKMELTQECHDFFWEFTIVNRLQWLGLERWRVAMSDRVESWDGDNARTRDGDLSRIYRALESYERLETTSLLEMRLWSIALDKAKPASEPNPQRAKIEGMQSTRNGRTLDQIDRQACRVKCGAETVISNVVPFLGNGFFSAIN